MRLGQSQEAFCRLSIAPDPLRECQYATGCRIIRGSPKAMRGKPYARGEPVKRQGKRSGYMFRSHTCFPTKDKGERLVTLEESLGRPSPKLCGERADGKKSRAGDIFLKFLAWAAVIVYTARRNKDFCLGSLAFCGFFSSGRVRFPCAPHLNREQYFDSTSTDLSPCVQKWRVKA